MYCRCDYSIYDNVVANNLYKYATKTLPLNKTYPQKEWHDKINYSGFHTYIGNLLDEYKINDTNRRQMFDHFLWYSNK